MKNFILKGMSMFLSFLIFTVSTNALASGKAVSLMLDLKSMSGEEVFRGVVFKEGTLSKMLYNAEDLAVVNNLNADVMKELVTAKSKIMSVIKTENPKYFSDFKTKILSNDHVVVYNALMSAKDYVRTIIQNQYKVTDSQIDKFTNADLKDGISKLNADRSMCVAVVVVAMVLVLWVLVIPFTESDTISYESASRLENEQLAAKLVEIN